MTKYISALIYIFMILVISINAPVSAAPLNGEVMECAQPDGSRVALRFFGDEFYYVMETLNGYTVIRDPETGWLCYALLSDDENEFQSTGVPVNEGYDFPLNIRKQLRINEDAVIAIQKEARAIASRDEDESLTRSATKAAAGAPTSGNVTGICLIVDFPDEPFTISPNDVDNFCNQVGYTGFGNNGSVRDYFYDISDGALTYTNYVPTAYYTTVFNKSYYNSWTRARQMVVEALNALEAGGFDFSLYDSDDVDLYIDGISCMYAGTTAGFVSHTNTLTWSADGVYARNYMITYMLSSLSLSTFCHESGHMLYGWPDLYDMGYDSMGVGKYCLMRSGVNAKNPIEPCAYLKDLVGWTATIDLLAPQTGLTLTAGTNTIYRYPNPEAANEYYLIENRQQSGRDTYIADSGLAIWHIDIDGSNNDQQMTEAEHYEVTLVQADGDWDLENNVNDGDTTDLWSDPGYTDCGPLTNPNTQWWSGEASGLDIYDISTSGATMTFSFDNSTNIGNWMMY